MLYSILDYSASDANLEDERLTGSSKYPSPDTKVHTGTPLARTGKQAPRYREQAKRTTAQVNSILGLSAEPTEYDYETIKPKDDSDEAMSSDLTYGLIWGQGQWPPLGSFASQCAEAAGFVLSVVFGCSRHFHGQALSGSTPSTVLDPAVEASEGDVS
ncbi:hypothetical protein AAWM_01883 [Aspergillus awamori]|uniref:Uncharacterized protein n=1 Tax=Aspergillus awamori TaxID=105351 RepID=A0A401KI33_ASPAW|nr:hypothetical protein AAWM_01883 [Aspergillus awamori]